MALAVEVAGKTDVGCVRANNEDNFGFDSRYGIFVVCDGMGGQAAGEVASKMGVDIILDYFRKETAFRRTSQLSNSDGEFLGRPEPGQRNSVGEPDDFSGRPATKRAYRHGIDDCSGAGARQFAGDRARGRQPDLPGSPGRNPAAH